MAGLKECSSQTAGPYVHIGCLPKTAGLEPRGMGPQLGTSMVKDATGGAQITLDITIKDGAGAAVTDGLVEIWHASPEGSFIPSQHCANWGRQAADPATGMTRFETLKPGAPAGQAPHILVWIAARGINLALITRIYFPDEDNSVDPVMTLAGARAKTLMATTTEGGYAHTITLQGPKETVFFDV